MQESSGQLSVMNTRSACAKEAPTMLARRVWLRWPLALAGLVVLLLMGPFGVLAFGDIDLASPW
ncbi:MAG: hypothetical protein ABIN37_11720, partial [Burkholderiaceae bacterium]